MICVDCSLQSGVVFIGSENFSTSSLSYNRELGVVTNSIAAIRAVRAAVSSDFAVGTPLGRSDEREPTGTRRIGRQHHLLPEHHRPRSRGFTCRPLESRGRFVFALGPTPERLCERIEGPWPGHGESVRERHLAVGDRPEHESWNGDRVRSL